MQLFFSGLGQQITMAINFNTAFGPHENALLLRAKRSEVLASNIANANTPGYKARDFDFQKAIKLATHQQNRLSNSKPGLNVELKYIQPFQVGTGDGNTVDLPSQQTAFAENAMEYQMSLRFLNGKIKGLLSAIKGE